MGMSCAVVGKAEKSNAMSLTAQEQSIQQCIKTYPDSEVSHIHDLHILICTDHQGRPCALTWYGRQGQPKDNFYFTSLQRRTEYVERITNAAAARVKAKEDRKAKRRASVPKFEVGDIYASSWGFEQTNVNYYQVVEKPSAHYAILKEIGQETVPGSSGNMSCKVMPVKDSFLHEESHRKKVSLCDDLQYIKLCSVKYAYPWDGKPDYKSWYH